MPALSSAVFVWLLLVNDSEFLRDPAEFLLEPAELFREEEESATSADDSEMTLLSLG